MLLAFLRKYVAIQLILGWPMLLVVYVAPQPWPPEVALSVAVFEVCLTGMAYGAAESEVWWKTRGPGLWER